MTLAPVDTSVADVRPNDLRRLWCKFAPPVNLIFPVWDAARWRTEFAKSTDRGQEAGKSIFPSLDEAGRAVLADWLVGLGPLVATGDMYALNYYLLVLTGLHGMTGIHLHEAYSLMNSLPNASPPPRRSQDRSQVLGQNIVLIGGPAGNPIAKELLETYNAQSLFPDAPGSDFRIRLWGKLEVFLEPKLRKNKDQTDEDCGLLLVGRNPWAKEEDTWFMAAMGSASWGTQACAALACSEAGASDLAKSKVETDPIIGEADWVREIGYVKVWPKVSTGSNRPGRLPDLTVPDSEFQMVSPVLGDRHTNPDSILRAGDMLRLEHEGPTMAIGFRPAVLVLAIGCLCLASAIGVLGVFGVFGRWLGPILCAFTVFGLGTTLLLRSLRVGGGPMRLNPVSSDSRPAAE